MRWRAPIKMGLFGFVSGGRHDIGKMDQMMNAAIVVLKFDKNTYDSL